MNLVPLFIILLFFLSLTLVRGHPVRGHPFDPLTPSEITTIAYIVKSSNLGSSKTLTFHYIGLDEPDKPTMLSYLAITSDAPPPPRQAFVIARPANQTHEIYIDITNKSIISNHIYEGFGYPVLTMEEQAAASELPMNYTPFIESVKRRRVQMKDVVCTTFTVGWFGQVKQGKRTIKVLCFVTGDTVNFYMRPLEGSLWLLILMRWRLRTIRIGSWFQFQNRQAPITEHRGRSRRLGRRRGQLGWFSRRGRVLRLMAT